MLTEVFAMLLVVVSNSVLSSAENEPSVQIIPKSSIYNVGDSKAIYCKGENLEEPLKWYGPDGKQIKGRSDAKSRVFVEKQNSNKSSSILLVLIQRAQLEDTGNWTCRSSNLESTISVLVGERAEIKPMEENVEGEEGSKVTLNCNARGKPRPDAQWYHGHGDPKEHRISEDTNPQKYVVERKGTNLALMIKNLNHNDSGEYICKVTQKALSYYTDSQVVLNVIHKPIIHLVHSTEVYALYNETKNITCSAKAFPAPEYAWYRRVNNFDEPIEDEGMIFTSEDKSYSVLILRVYSEEDLTEYKCTATNKKGSESVIFDVSLGNKPEPPDYVEVIGSSLDQLVFNVTCRKCTFSSSNSVEPQAGNLTVTGYAFQLVSVEEAYPPNWDKAITVMVDIVDPANTTFPVGNLSNSTTFHARVQTCNQAGCSDWLDVHPDPKTTDFGVTLTAMPILMLTIGIILLF